MMFKAVIYEYQAKAVLFPKIFDTGILVVRRVWGEAAPNTITIKPYPANVSGYPTTKGHDCW